MNDMVSRIDGSTGIRIQKGDMYIDARYMYEFNLKKPCLLIWKEKDKEHPYDPHGLVRVASFTSEEYAIMFMDYLAEMMDAEREEE